MSWDTPGENTKVPLIVKFNRELIRILLVLSVNRNTSIAPVMVIEIGSHRRFNLDTMEQFYLNLLSVTLRSDKIESA